MSREQVLAQRTKLRMAPLLPAFHSVVHEAPWNSFLCQSLRSTTLLAADDRHYCSLQPLVILENGHTEGSLLETLRKYMPSHEMLYIEPDLLSRMCSCV